MIKEGFCRFCNCEHSGHLHMFPEVTPIQILFKLQDFAIKIKKKIKIILLYRNIYYY